MPPKKTIKIKIVKPKKTIKIKIVKPKKKELGVLVPVNPTLKKNVRKKLLNLLKKLLF